MAHNVFGDPLEDCSRSPMTGFFRNGKCDTCAEDQGMHTVCVELTEDFLTYSKQQGNDLSTPKLEWEFPGLQPGSYWCLCMGRWIEAYNAGMAPKLVLEATHASVLEFVDLEILKGFAAKPKT